MGFVADAVDKVGNQFGFGGGANQFRAQGDYAPGIATAQTGALDQSGQQAFIQALQQQMRGGPSVAQGMLQQATDMNNANAAGAIGGVRGINPALAARMVLDQRNQNQQMAAGQGAILRAGEMMNTQGMLGQALNAQRGQNIGALQTLGGMQQGVNQINAGVAGQNANISSNAIGGLLNGAGGAAAAMFSAGGEVPTSLIDPMTYIGIQSVPNPWSKPGAAKPAAKPGGAQPYGADSFLTGDMTGGAAMFGKGGPVDSSKNDTVPAKLSPGEIVLPVSVAQAKDAPEKAAAFVRAIRRQNQEPEGYGHALRRVRELDSRLKRVEAMCAGGMVR